MTFFLFLAGAVVSAIVFQRLRDVNLEIERLRAEVSFLDACLRDVTRGQPWSPPEADRRPAATEVRPATPVAPPTGAATAPGGRPEREEPPAAATPVSPPASPPAAPATPEPPSHPRRTLPNIDWERWVGVRGFAVLGGAVLALAGLLFVRELAERGFFPPWMRIAITAAVGVAAVVAGRPLRARGYDVTANALAGAGVVLLYGSVWAGHRLFALLSTVPALAAMVAITVLCGFLAWRHRTAVIAGLGLVGGFLTPLLTAGKPDLLGLFGYLLILDAGALWLTRKRAWPGLATASLLATVLYQLVWLGLGLRSSDHPLAIAIFAATAALFVFASSGPEAARGRPGWSGLRAGGLLFPFAFGVYFASRADLDPGFGTTVAFVVVLSAAVLWLEARRTLPDGAADAAAVGGLGIAAAWALRHWGELSLAWSTVAAALVLALPFHVAFVLAGRRGRPDPRDARPASLAAAGHLGLLVAVGSGPPAWPGPWLLGWIVLAGLLLHQATAVARRGRAIVASLGLALGLGLHAKGTVVPDGPFVLWSLVLAAGLLALVLWWRRAFPGRDRTTAAAAYVFPFVTLLALAPEVRRSEVALWPLAILACGLGIVAAVAAARAPSGGAYAAAAYLASGTVFLGALDQPGWLGPVTFLLAILMTTAGPLLLSDLGGRRWAIGAAAGAAPLALLPLDWLWRVTWGDRFLGLVPASLGAITLAVAVAAARVRTGSALGATRTHALRLPVLAAAAAFAALVVPRQLDHQWGIVGSAWVGLALLLLWHRTGRLALEQVGIAAVGLASFLLVALGGLDGGHADTGAWIWNWLHYRHAAVALGAVAATVLLARGWDREAGAGATRLESLVAAGISSAVVVFVWITRTVFDAFAAGPGGHALAGSSASRDLVLSMAWALYAMALLALGVRRSSVGLRWASLAVLVVTILKVFLYDLRELEGLYRIGSLAGLAVSLLLVSLAYQRFVFRGTASDRVDTTGD